MNERIKNFPIVSVLMPAYNALPLIRASIASLLSQTYKNAEDLYAPNSLEVMLGKMLEHPEVALVSASMCSFGTRTDIVRKRGAEQETIIVFDGRHYPNHASSMMRAERAKRFEYNPLMKLGQDRDFLERYLAGQKFMCIPDILYYYSEFDSVSKQKIKRTYRLNMAKYAQSGDFRQWLTYLSKYIFACVVFPFLSTDNITKRRCTELSEDEYNKHHLEGGGFHAGGVNHSVVWLCSVREFGAIPFGSLAKISNSSAITDSSSTSLPGIRGG